MVLGNGGTTAFWDAATCCLVRERALHLVYGEFSSKFAACTRRAPFLADPIVIEAEPGDAPEPAADPRADVIAWAHNETSTGVMVPVVRGRPTRPSDALVLIDATSGARRAAGRRRDRPTRTTSRRRRASRSDGGLWLALLSPAALERIGAIARPRPTGAGSRSSCRCDRARELASRTRPTTRPAIATLFLLADQLDWMLDAGRPRRRWSRAPPSPPDTSTRGPSSTSTPTPFVSDPAKRSLVVGTIDFDDEVDAAGPRGDAARQRDRRRRAVPQARPQPAADRDVPGDRPERRARR